MIFPISMDLALACRPIRNTSQPSHGLPARIDNHGIITHDCTTSGDSGLKFGPTSANMSNNNININNNNKNNNNKNNNGNSNIDNSIEKAVRSSVIVPPVKATGVNSPANNSNGNVNNTKMHKLGAKVSQLVEFLKGRTNVHKEIVSMSLEIQAIFMQVSADLPKSIVHNETVLVDANTQTDEVARPKLLQMNTPKRKRDSESQSPKAGKPKKRKNVPTQQQTKECNEHKSSNAQNENVAMANTESKWERVKPKARKKKRPPRPDALVIETRGDTSYADILKKVKSDPKLANLGKNVKTIKKTAKGELLLELNGLAQQSTYEFSQSVEEVIGTEAAVRVRTHEVFMEIKDIDEVTTKEEVFEALVSHSEEFKVLQTTAVKSMRKAYGGTQTATIGMNAILAEKLIQLSRIRIGWVICRIREKISPRRCFKCLDFGHPTAKCKSPNDFTDNCLRCGETGHKIKTCNNVPNCVLCRPTSGKSDHTTGARVCPFYFKALQNLKKRL